jgi:hypothetical protein
MIRRVRAALGLSLALTAFGGPAHARAPKKKPVPVIEVGAGPEIEEGVDEGLAPGVEEGVGEGVAPEAEAGGGEAEPIDPPLDEGDAPSEPPTADVEDGTEPSTSPTDMPAPSTPAGTHDVPADDFEAEAGLAPGGYHGHGVILERAPPDGRNRIIVGSILVPLGTLATVTSAVGTWMTVPAHCAERLSGLGIEATADRCQGLFTFNVIRTTYGVLMLGSGATILVLGMLQREKYRRWRHEHGMRARFEPTIGLPGRGTASLGLRVRF